MAGEHKLAIEGDVELARTARNEFEFAETSGFKQHLRTEGAFLVTSGLTVVDLYFHGLILSDLKHKRKRH
jgi:hypothetical protein